MNAARSSELKVVSVFVFSLHLARAFGRGLVLLAFVQIALS